MKKLFPHLSRHREFYLLLPAKALLLFLVIVGVNHLTGRAVIDDPGAIVGYLYTFTPLVVLIGLVGFVQDHLIGFRGDKQGATVDDDVFDACVFFALLGSFTFVVWLFR